MPESRTRERALAELKRLLPGVRGEIADEKVKALLTEKLLSEVFNIAWSRQFDDDPSQATRLLRQVIRESMEGLGES